MLGLLWTDEQAEGKSIADDEVLFMLKFIANRVGEECDVNITSAMIPVEAVNGNLELLELAEWKEEITSIDEDDFSNRNRLYQNYPNPFSEGTLVSFELREHDKVTLTIYDLPGRKMEEITGNYGPGKHNIQMGVKLNPGVYYLRFQTPDHSRSLKMLCL